MTGPALSQPGSRGDSPASHRNHCAPNCQEPGWGRKTGTGDDHGRAKRSPPLRPPGWEQLSPPGSHARSGLGSFAHTFPAQHPPAPSAPPLGPLRPRWLQLKSFVLFPLSQNKPLCSELILLGQCRMWGPAWFYVVPDGLYVPAGWRGHGLGLVVLVWAVSVGTCAPFS